MNVGLRDKVVVITGAASGIGAAIALHAAEAGAGAVMLCDRDAEGLAQVVTQVAQTQVGTVVADLGETDAPARIIDATLARFGRIDGLVNAAGLTDRAGVEDGTLALWDTLFAVNARAAFFLMQGAVRDMRGRNAPGTIVNILSVNAHCGAPDLAVYSASKAALSTLTKNAAHAHMAHRIRVNGINLGWVATPGEHRLQSQVLGKGEDWQDAIAGDLPLGRLVTATEAARLALYLLSDASAPMTGVALDLEQRVLGAPA